MEVDIFLRSSPSLVDEGCAETAIELPFSPIAR
jgi:hypothetical protein